MNTYGYLYKVVLRRGILAVLILFVLFALSGCKKQEGEPAGSTTPEVTKSLENTEQPEPTSVQETQNPEEGLKGTLTRETFPVIDGSTATIPLSEAVYQYMTGASAEEAAQAITHTKTTNSYKRLYNKEVDLLIVYEPSEEIVKRMEQKPLLMKPIGLDALVFMANAANTVESLTMEELVSIYRGDITNWSEVGGEDKKLLAFQRPAGSGSQTLMQKLVMGETEMMSGDNVFRYSTMSDILEGMLSYNGEDNTLGYSVFYYANNMYYFPDLKFMGVDGVLPSTQTIYDGSYPLINEFYAVIRPDEPENSMAHQLFDWLTGEEGQQMILELGYVPVSMPEGASLVTKQPERTETTEVTAHYPLPDGEYYVFFEPQNIGHESEYGYGNLTVYDDKWKVSARLYNVVFPERAARGRFMGRYLPVGQIRQDTAGEQKTVYGVYDLEEGEYSVAPRYQNMEVLDAERHYYAVLEPGGKYDEYVIIDGEGCHLLENVCVEDWLTIWRSGDGYEEMTWYSDEEGYGEIRSFYDASLNLITRYYSNPLMMPPESERIEGVTYGTFGEQGLLLDQDGTVLIDEEKFLKRYGNGETKECVLQFIPFSGVDITDYQEEVYDISYCGSIYLVDRNLDLVRKVNRKHLPNVNQISYYRDFYMGYDTVSQTTRYYSYEDAELTMSDGALADGVSMNDGSYILWKKADEFLVVEEHIVSEPDKVYRYEYPYGGADKESVELMYYGKHYIVWAEDTGETVYFNGARPWMHYALYCGSKKVCEQEGLWNHLRWTEDGKLLWEIGTDEKIQIATESLYEEAAFLYLDQYFVVEGEKVLFSTKEPAYLQALSDGFAELNIGSYTYVYDYAGNQFIKALNHSLGAD